MVASTRGSCVIELVDSETADRERVSYEIQRVLTEGTGFCGIGIRNLRHRDGKQSRKGRNPFESVADGVRHAVHLKVRDSREKGSQHADNHIADHIEGWGEEAVRDAEVRGGPVGKLRTGAGSRGSGRYASVAFGILMTEPLSPNVVRHLEMIQDVIHRMADNSFTVRRWNIGAAGALIGAAVVTDEPVIAFVGAVMAMVFWVLDAYYLRQERWFRALYDKVRAEPDEVEAFAMATKWPPTRGASLPANFFSLTEWLSHLPLVLAAVAVGLVLALGG